MEFMVCPNCGQIYNDGKTFYCNRCNYRLKPQDSVGKIKHPELRDNSDRVIGYVSSQSSHPTVTCPYCKSTKCKRITATAKAINVALFGIFGNKRRYQWHCNECKSDF